MSDAHRHFGRIRSFQSGRIAVGAGLIPPPGKMLAFANGACTHAMKRKREIRLEGRPFRPPAPIRAGLASCESENLIAGLPAASLPKTCFHEDFLLQQEDS